MRQYHPVSDNQKWLDLRVFQGEARMTRDNILLGSLKIALPALSRADSGVDIRFTYDVNGLLQVEATVLKTMQTHTLMIEGHTCRF